ncbi:MAG: polysaccharide ABC transporter ATP-binding protein [Thermodesulfobacteriota bacterium]
MTIAIRIDNLSKLYRLGVISTGYLFSDLQSWWAKIRGKEDPHSLVGLHSGGDGGRSQYIWALRDLSLEVEQGKVLGIIGRNGAGKSTLLKIISRITAPTEGEVRLKGRVASLLEIGTGFHPYLTGRENIFLNGVILGMTVGEIKRKFDEIVEFSGLEKFIDTPVKRYSSGMYVRLAFAVAAHLESENLLVDEVLAVGDAEFHRKCLGKMGEITQAGRTVLFVSHNMDAVASLCDRVAWIDNGQLQLVGEPKEVINRYYDAMMSLGAEAGQTEKSLRTGKIFTFQRSYLVDDDGAPADYATLGEAVNMVVEYTAHPEIRAARLLINLVLGHAKVPTLFSCPYELPAPEMARLPLAGRLVCRVPVLPLAPGLYQMSYAAWVNEQFVDNGSSLVMVKEDEAPTDSGAPGLGGDPGLSRYRSHFLVPFKWSLEAPAQREPAQKLA